MTSHELSQKLSKLLEVLSDSSPLILLLQEMTSAFEDLMPVLAELLEPDYSEGSPSWGFVAEKQRKVKEVLDKLTQKRPARLLIMLDNLVTDLEVLEGNDTDTFSAIRSRIHGFYGEYEKSINNYSWPQTLKLLSSAKNLYDSILVYRDFVRLITEDLESDVDIPEDNKVVSLFFQSTTEYEEFLRKLVALDHIYSELCLLTNVSKSQYPLGIIKLESGSLWIKLFGESKVMTLLTSLIESAANFLYRNFTDEGKITTIPRSVDAIESVLSLTKKLEAEGIDVSASKDNLQKAAVVISAQLNKLLLKEPSIEVDGKRHSVAEAVQDKYMLEGQRLLLDDGTKKVDES